VVDSPSYRDLKIYVLALIITVVGCNFLAQRFLGQTADENATRRDRHCVIEFKRASPPPRGDGPRALVVGNSHTYAIPGRTPDEPLRVDSESIFLEQLSGQVQSRAGLEGWRFHLVARPNFLPTEMLIRIGKLLVDEPTPRVLILGVTWRNIARDITVRSELNRLLRDAEEYEKLRNLVAGQPANDLALEMLASERRRAEVSLDKERQKADGDKWDEALVEAAASGVTLLGQNATLRGNLYRLMEKIQFAWETGQKKEFTYDCIPADLAVNKSCVWTLLSALHQHGVRVVCYLVPERHDLPLLVDPKLQESFNQELSKRLQEIGGELIDARDAVPDQYWGYVSGAPDRSHFSEPGHEIFATFLLRELDRLNVWSDRVP
jgi:hypothetical protein